MAANRVSDLTVEELRALIRETIYSALEEIMIRENEDDLEFKDEVADYLREYLKEKPVGEPADQVMKDLGLWEDE